MRSVELFALAWRNLMRRKSRTFLTVLSVVIGAVAIILMLSFGYGMQETQRQQIAQFSQMNAISVNPTADPSNERARQGLIGEREVKKIEGIEHVKAVLPTMYVPFNLEFKNHRTMSMFGSTYAIDFSRLDPTTMTFESGSLPVSTKNHPYLVGNAVTLHEFDIHTGEGDLIRGENWDQYDIRMKPEDYGMLGQGSSLTGGQNKGLKLTFGGQFKSSDLLLPGAFYISLDTYDELVKMEEQLQADNPELAMNPFDSMMPSVPSETDNTQSKKKRKRERYYDQLVVTVDDLNNTSMVVDQINEMGLNASANSEMIDSQMEAFKIIELIFGGIGSIALLVSAIGIANTMLMSIHERTREIGVMKVIGAQVSDIRRMFLIEAMLIALIGGVLGILVSFGLSALINTVAKSFMSEMQAFDLEYISYIPLWLPIVAFFFSGLIGLLAGSLPARRATKISAIEAIRTE
ncbi:MAG: ABC transporter permease [Peptoniphilaceae bacterium]|nr:ABC transporter permease [Peptoniphilaceae bacterium]MDY6085776.1 ABC transporter permease [Peptoniphilaceae bacterium]